ncbi:MAG TPA: GNAT family N-acetyltransferase [Prolixibacteraceae bacterium]|nr:GNAT family N-acetyltransferase [Prolixibacteraceae bacterium]
MKIVSVASRKDAKAFHNVARIIYKNDPVWVCPIDNEIEAIFDSKKNVYFSHGEAIRWLLYNDEGQLIGRVAAFVDYKMAQKQSQPTGGMGFFECINDQEAACLLFDTARDWLKSKGMEAMDGPINFGETDKYWGLLVDGFTHPSYEIPYNHPYYQELFEQYGFQTYYKQEGFHLDITKPLPPKFMKIAEWVSKKPDYTFEHFEWKQADRFANDFCDVFNQAWASFKENFEPLEVAYIKKTLNKAKAIIDEEFIWFAYNKNKPIAIYFMYPDVNQIFKKLNGKLDIVAMLKFLYYKKQKTMTRARGVLMGVIPQFQGLGIESAFIYHVSKAMEKRPQYTEIEFSWVADFNPKMRKIFIAVGSVPAKHYITYRYLFDREIPFKRYPIPE